MIVAGVIGGFAAALFGWIDWFAIPPGTRAKRIGLLHGIGNVVVLLLFVGSWWLRRDALGAPDTLAHVLSFAGTGRSIHRLARTVIEQPEYAPIVVLATKTVALRDRLRDAENRFAELAASRTGTQSLQEKTSALLIHWYLHGRN